MLVNWNSGRYFLSLALLAVFLYWPSDLLVSYWGEEGSEEGLGGGGGGRVGGREGGVRREG